VGYIHVSKFSFLSTHLKAKYYVTSEENICNLKIMGIFKVNLEIQVKGQNYCFGERQIC
jgi:hypothetical protein